MVVSGFCNKLVGGATGRSPVRGSQFQGGVEQQVGGGYTVMVAVGSYCRWGKVVWVGDRPVARTGLLSRERVLQKVGRQKLFQLIIR